MKYTTHEHRTGRPITFVILLSTCLFLATSLSYAQRYLAAIAGEVTDSSGARVPGAKVTAVEAATNYTTRVVTSGDGVYSFPALNPGTYTVINVRQRIHPLMDAALFKQFILH